MNQNTEKGLLFIVRYAPILLILVLSFFITYSIEEFNYKNYAEEKERITKLYKDFNNDELKEEIYKIHDYLHTLDTNSIDTLKQNLKQKVYEAHEIATRIYEDNKTKKTEKEILDLIKISLGSIFFNQGRGYYFIDDIRGVKILQPLNKELEGQNLYNFKDAKGYTFVKNIVKTIQEKTERYDTYYWYKNGDVSKSYEKISFYKYFAPLNVAIGTGEYIDDYMKELKAQAIAYIQNIKLNDDGYVFLLDETGTMLAHKNKENIGKNFYDLTDARNLKSIQKIIEIAQQGEGFLTYVSRTLKKDPYEKTSFIKGYSNWNWVLGTGYSSEALEEILKEVKLNLDEKNKNSETYILVVSLLATIILLLSAIVVSYYIEKIFKHYRLKIRNEEKQFRNLFDNSNIGLVLCDNKGKILRINPKFLSMMNYTYKDVIDKTWFEISSENDIEEENLYFNFLSNKKLTYSVEKVLKNKHEKNIDVLITGKMFKIEENDYVLFSIIDITHVKEKDKMIFQQSKMASMGEMIANIAHQWRQPLSMISTASSGVKMKSDYDMLDKEQLSQTMDEITQATHYLSHTINDFQNFFKPTNSITKFNLKEIVERAINLTSAQFKSSNITIEHYTDDLNLFSFENDLIQILINLIKNSKDALDKSNQESKKIEIKAESFVKENKVIIKVWDNAGGIDDSIINKIFEPYFTTKNKSQGTGLGLYMVQQIVTEHLKGNITVQNISGGAEFDIEIPILLE